MDEDQAVNVLLRIEKALVRISNSLELLAHVAKEQHPEIFKKTPARVDRSQSPE